MQKFIRWIYAHFEPFRTGFFAGFGVWGGLLYSRPAFFDSLAWEFVVKLIMAAALGFATALGTILATDFKTAYKNYRKKIKDARERKEIERGKKQERA